MLQVPDGRSAVIDDTLSTTPGFAADIVGTYTAFLHVNDGSVDSDMNKVSITGEDSPPPRT